MEGDERKVDFNKVLAEAKSLGYKLKKSEIFANHSLFHYDGSYFRMALVDITFGIIDDGEEATVYHVPNSIKPMYIKTSVGLAMVLPINRTTEDPERDEGKIIVELE